MFGISIGFIFLYSAWNREERELTASKSPGRELDLKIVKIGFTNGRQSIEIEIETDPNRPLETNTNFYKKNNVGEIELAEWDLLNEESGELNIEKYEEGPKTILTLNNLPEFYSLEVEVTDDSTTESKTFIPTEK